MSAYLDNSATTKPCEECVSAVVNMLTDNFGNASSLHDLGIKAMKEIILARGAVADSLGVDKDEIIFTSGATEANNMALFGSTRAKGRLGKRIVTTAIEHESVLQSAQQLEKQGFEVIYLEPDSRGNITEKQLFDAVNKDTILVSMMYINNEVGTVMPVKSIAKAVKAAGAPALVHIDCALYVNKNANLTDQNFARTFGGEQEKRLRPGTESSPLIAGFGAAVKALPNVNEQKKKIKELNLYARQKLAEIDGIKFNNDEDTSPYILNVYIPTFMRSQTVLQELSAKYGVYVSNGSACAKGKKSHVLTAMGLPNEIIDKSIRVSFSRYNTKDDVDLLASSLDELVKTHPLK